MTSPVERPDTTAESTTVAEAAAFLGVTPDAVRRRLHRGTLTGTKTDEGVWRVWLPDYAPGPDPDDRQDVARTPPVTADIVIAYEARLSEMRADLDFLRSELDHRTEEIRRRDHIIAGFLERLPEARGIAAGEIIMVETEAPEFADTGNASQDANSAPLRGADPQMAQVTLTEASVAPAAGAESLPARLWRAITGH